MNRTLWTLVAFAGVTLAAGAAWAGGGGGAPPGGGGGGSAPEPELYALILFSLLPGIYFIRRSITAQRIEEV